MFDSLLDENKFEGVRPLTAHVSRCHNMYLPNWHVNSRRVNKNFNAKEAFMPKHTVQKFWDPHLYETVK